MITLKQPSLALHSCDVPGYEYRMWASWKMTKGARPMDILYWILYARDRTPELLLRNVVINCHGLDGRLFAGGDGQPSLNNDNINIFSQLRGSDLGTIWLVACKVANTGHGKGFCQRLARLAGCSVVAADATQYRSDLVPQVLRGQLRGTHFRVGRVGEKEHGLRKRRRDSWRRRRLIVELAERRVPALPTHEPGMGSCPL